MTVKPKKTKRLVGTSKIRSGRVRTQKVGTRQVQTGKLRSGPVRVGDLRASVEDDLLSLAEEETGVDPRWNRPRKQRLSMRVDVEVVEWFKSRGPGYQTRINRILRRVMTEGKKRPGER